MPCLMDSTAKKDARVLVDLEQKREKLKEIQLEWEQLKRSAVGLEPIRRQKYMVDIPCG